MSSQARIKTWRKLKCVSLNERSPFGKATNCKILTIRHSGRGKTIETEKNISDCHVEGDGWGIVEYVS